VRQKVFVAGEVEVLKRVESGTVEAPRKAFVKRSWRS
jgi:hypothetical protein